MKPQQSAIILAAGYGSRISDVTAEPKSLLVINDMTLMDRHFAALKKAGIQNVVVVTGYKRELVEGHLSKFKMDFDLQFALNEDYRVKGNTYSLFYGLEKTAGDFLLFDADLIYDAKILTHFVSDPVANQVLVGESSLDDIECTKTMIDKETGIVRMFIDKRAVTDEELKRFTFAGEAMGILKFSKHYRDEMMAACERFLQIEKNVAKNWEYVMNEFLTDHEMFVHRTVSNRWVEIDNKEDLEKAKLLFE